MDQIYKLQPHRTMHLQGFDDYGAAAALWGASDTGFTVSGVFRDLADFAVLVLFQKDDPFGHPLFSYLPMAISPASYSISTSHGRAFSPGSRSRTRGPTGTRSTAPSTASARTT